MYFCTSKTSKLSTWFNRQRFVAVELCLVVALDAYVRLRAIAEDQVVAWHELERLGVEADGGVDFASLHALVALFFFALSGNTLLERSHVVDLVGRGGVVHILGLVDVGSFLRKRAELILFFLLVLDALNLLVYVKLVPLLEVVVAVILLLLF